MYSTKRKKEEGKIDSAKETNVIYKENHRQSEKNSWNTLQEIGKQQELFKLVLENADLFEVTNVNQEIKVGCGEKCRKCKICFYQGS